MTPGSLAERRFPGVMAPVQRSAQVDVEGLVEPRRIDPQRGAVVRVRRRVVDEDVEPAEALDGRRDTRRGGVEVPGVGGEHCGLARRPRGCDLGNCGFELLLLTGAEHDVGSGGGELSGDRLADAFRGPRDQRRLARQ